MNILCISSKNDDSSFLSLQLDLAQQHQIFRSHELATSLVAIKKNNIDTIIIESKKNDPLLNDLYSYLKSFTEYIPIIVFGNFPQDELNIPDFFKESTQNIFLELPVKKEQIFEIIKTMSSEEKEINGDYVPILLGLVEQFNSLPVDVYIKRESKGFLKIINRNSLYGKNIFSSFSKKNIADFFVKKNEYPDLLKMIDDGMNSELYNKKHKNFINRGTIHDNGIPIVSNFIQQLNIPPNFVFQIDNIIHNLIPVINNCRGLYLNDIAHSDQILIRGLMQAYLSTFIAEKMDAKAERTYEVLCISSLVKDLSNKGTDELEPKHPLQGALNVIRGRKLPLDVASIVRTHHELPDGSGFPQGLIAEKTPIFSALFIITQHIVNKYCEQGYSWSLSKIELIEQFDHGNYSRPLKAFLKIIHSANEHGKIF